MTAYVDHVKCKVTITLNDGSKVELSLATVGVSSNIKNYLTGINIKESTNTSNSNPVGVVSSNTLSLSLNSRDRSLLPDNEKSPYYGKMDNTACIDIVLTDDDGDITFNRFFVSNWESNVTSSNPYKVKIDATDLFSIINKNSVPDTELIKNANTKNVLINILNKLNQRLSDLYKINWDESEINFSQFPTLEFNNIEADNIGNYFNILSQSTLTNLYYGRDNKFKTDYLLDDKKGDSVCNLSDKVNILSASVNRGNLVNYSGVVVYYIINNINSYGELMTIENQVLAPGENIFDNIELGNKVFKIDAIKVKTDQLSPVQLVKLEYNKRTASLVLNNKSSKDATCKIIIYGQTLNETKLSVRKTLNDSNQMLEVTNSLLPKSSIDKFATQLLRMISIKGSTLTLTGFFNPRIKLGDIVYVDTESSLNTKGYYKVVELNWTVENTIKCNMKVIKTII